MTTTDLLCIFVAGALVALGVIAGAVADRIRQAAPFSRAEIRERRDNTKRSRVSLAAGDALRADVIRALSTSGYRKADAASAADACALSERATIESWTRAALRKAAS